MSPDQLSAHFQVDRYGSFQLTEAVRPSADLLVIPREGYRCEIFRDARHRLAIPVLVASISAEHLFDVFLALLRPLGEVVDVILETSHHEEGPRHGQLTRAGIDLPVLMSHFCDFEDLLLNDGCTGVAVLDRRRAVEVLFDEHKLCIIYARDLQPFERILREWGVPHDNRLRVINEAAHLHSTEPHHEGEFLTLMQRLGIRGAWNWTEDNPG